MTPTEILFLISQSGIRLWTENRRLRYHAKKGALTPDLRRLISEHRDSIIVHLNNESGRPSDTYPLSYNQQFLWLLHRLDPLSSAYNVAFVARVVSSIDFIRLATAIQELVDRHAMLRATYDSVGGVPFMRIHSSLDLACEHIDASGWDEESLDREVHQRYREPFDLAAGPILRVQIFTRAPEDHILLLTIHHIACDGWSIGILLKEFRHLYAMNPAIDLPHCGASYTDFTRYQSEILKGPQGERLFRFWKEKLGGVLPELDLPVDKQRRPTRVPHGGTRYFSIAGDLYRKIVSLARNSGTTLYTFLLAAFQVLLMRYSSQEDILIGTPMTSRPRKEDESTVGCYINTIVLRETVSAGSTFRELLGRTRKTFTEAFEHRDYPFSLLVEHLCPARDPGRSPIVQVMFNFLNRQTLGEVANLLYRDKSKALAEESVLFGDLTMRPFPMTQEEGQFDLALEMIDNNLSLTGLLKYSADLYEEATAARMASHFQILLQSIVSNPDQRLSGLPVLTEVERQQLLVSWNATEADYSKDKTLGRLFEEQARRTPEAAAVSCRGVELSYGDLNRRVNQLAGHLRKLGVGPDVFVGICMERSVDMVVGLLGVLKAGGAYVPLDPGFPKDRLEFMLEDSGAPILVTQSALAGELTGYKGKVVCIDSDGARISKESPHNFEAVGTPEDLAYVMYTSGSTGKPKGVQISQRALVNFLYSMRREPGLTSTDTVLSVTTISFDIFGLELYLPLITGAKVVLAEREEAADGARLMELLRESKASVMQATPATWRLLLQAGWQGERSLRIFCGGEALPQDLVAPLLDRCKEFWNLYGPTETTIWSTVYRIKSKDDPILIGHPIANTQVYILDQSLQPVPIGVAGEFLIGGDGLARGYWNRPELTAEKFIRNPFSDDPGARIYKTGDLARYRPDGSIECLGRIDHQVKVRGFRIELGEIEATLAELDEVNQCAVAVREDRPGDQRLVAYYVTKNGAEVSTSDWRTYLRTQLPDYMVPQHFVKLEAMPLTPNGKVDRKALPTPDMRAASDKEYVAPRTAIERQIAAIWQEVLQQEQIGVNDDFFELGGHSLLATQVLSRLNRQFNMLLPLRRLFEARTVEALTQSINMAYWATQVRQGQGNDDPQIENSDREVVDI